MTLYELDSDLYYINLALSFAVTWESRPAVYMGEVTNVYLWLMVGG